MSEQPRWRALWERRPQMPVSIYANPFELALGWILIAGGVRGAFGDVTPSLMALGQARLTLYLIVSTLGGVGLVVALMTPQKYVRRRSVPAPVPWTIALERASLFCVTAGYFGLGLMLVANNPSRGIGFAIVVSMAGVACVLRIVAIRRTTRAVLRALRAQQGDL